MRNEYQMKNSIVLTLLIFTFSFFFCLSCDNSIDPPEIHPPMSGYGRISVDLTEEEATARTVFPAIVFDRYVYTFTKLSPATTTGETAGVVKTPGSDGFFILEVGSYTVEVRAYTGDAEPYTLAASGVSSEFSVGPGSNEPVAVRLTGVAGTGQGEFRYTITYPADAAAEITLQKWPGLDEIALTPANLTAGNGVTETLQLETGFYLLSVLVSKTGQYAGISEMVHIYPSLSTVYAKNYVDEDLHALIPPMVNDYNIGEGIFTYDGNTKAVTITPKQGKSTGSLTIYYNGSTTAPSAAGAYTVTFDVEATKRFSEAAGLPAGTLTINKAAGATVNAPTLNTRTVDIITINEVSAPENGQSVEYAINTTDTAPLTGWQAKTTLSGLDAGATYYIFARSAENNNYETGAPSGSLTVATLQPVSPDRIVYYWVNQHGSLVTTGNGATTVATGGTLVITAQEDGYVVKQWYLNGKNTGESGNTYNFSSTTAGYHTVALFVEKGGKLYNTNIAITVIVPYTVTFNANDGSGTVPSAQRVLPGSSITLPSGSGLSRTGYIFGGWSSSGGTNYNAGASYTVTGNVTLYARWLTAYIVTFNANDGSGTVPSAQTVLPSSSITLPDGDGLSRTGYAFGGWNTNTSGMGTTYSAGSSYTVTGNITLYARWMPLRTVAIDMYDSAGDGWDGGGALRITVNGVEIAANVSVPSGSDNTYTFTVTMGDVVRLYWVAGSAQHENSFIAYYANTPPSPAFTASNNNNWNGSNALVYRLRAISGTTGSNYLTNVADGTLLGSFTVQ